MQKAIPDGMRRHKPTSKEEIIDLIVNLYAHNKETLPEADREQLCKLLSVATLPDDLASALEPLPRSQLYAVHVICRTWEVQFPTQVELLEDRVAKLEEQVAQLLEKKDG